jgi:hypothetical protein
MEGEQPTSLSKVNLSVFFSVKKIELNHLKILFSEEADVFLKLENNILSFQSLSTHAIEFSINDGYSNKRVNLLPGNITDFKLNQ